MTDIKEFINNFGDSKGDILSLIYDLFFEHDNTHVILTDEIGGNTGKSSLIKVIEELSEFLQDNPIHSVSRYLPVEENVKRWMKGNPERVLCYKNYVDPKSVINNKKWVIECTAEEMKNVDYKKIQVIELTEKFNNSDFRVNNLFNDPIIAKKNCYTLIAMSLLQAEE